MNTNLNRIEREYKAADNTLETKNADLETALDRLKLSPVGSIVAWIPRVAKGQGTAANVPEGWLRCDGSVIP